MRILFGLLIVLFPHVVTSQIKYPAAIEAVLKKAGQNRIELEKALDHFYQNGDSLKIAAIHFLLENMDIHYSADYYWANDVGDKVPYNELHYASFDEAVQSFEIIKQKTPGIHPVAYRYRDIDSIKGDFLIDNVDLAFESWKSGWSKNIPFKDFCEYILPYRASVEPLHNWRKIFKEKFAWVYGRAKDLPVDSALVYLAMDFNKWFINTYEIESRKEPLPRLGALQLLSRKKGPCEDIADLAVFALRSQGIVAANDFVSYWATSFGKHFCNSTLNSKGEPIRFDVSTSTVRFTTFAREPAKVIRTTYSKQPGVLAEIERQENIPPGFLQTFNYIDVTSQYWETANVTTNLFTAQSNKIVYACVLNGGSWKPTWWAKVHNGKATFTNLTKGVVYLPVYFANGKQLTAGYPVAVGYQNQKLLAPSKELQTITLKQQDKYLVFRNQKRYKLFYWDSGWKLIGEKMAGESTTQLTYDKVPRNALLLLVPEYTKRKERPFIIEDNGERIWF